uniref:Major facilitator superfamily (MFS) profile domain-containing protein n=2 Tax=Heliothis virescens TaxID=7102 RepID=A0A2A4J4T8_HELVI
MDSGPKENSDLLKAPNKAEANGNPNNEDQNEPPDGGVRAYMVMIASFIVNGLFFGVINSYSVVYTVLEKQLKNEGVQNSESRAALVGALTMGTTFLLSPVSGVLTGLLGIRQTAVLGGVIASVAMLLSSFFVYNVGVLSFTYGIMYGLGVSLAYTPSLAILGHYFKKRLGAVNGFVTVGSSIFTVFMPPLMEYIIIRHGLVYLYRFLALFTLSSCLCGVLYKPSPSMVIKTTREDDSWKSLLKSIINVEIWKIRKYRFWAISMPVALFGYFVPYVHIKKFIETSFTNVNANLPLQCIATASAVGRLMFGFLADRPGIDRVFLQQISFYVIGSLTIILPFITKFGLVIVIALCMGIFDGAFIALIGPIAFEFCGGAHAAQAIGCMLGIAATPLSVGPPVAGYLYGIKKSYTLPFVLGGLSPIIGATLMFIIRFQRDPANDESINSNGVTTRPTSNRTDKPGLLLRNGTANQQTNL